MPTTKTELLNNGVVVATNTVAPFDTFNWDTTGVTGAVSLTVKTYVDGVLAATSPTVTGTVNPSYSYTVEITSPIEGQEFEEGAPILIEANGQTLENTYKVMINSPKEGQIFTEGDDILIESEGVHKSSLDNPFNIEQSDYLHFITYGQSLSMGGDSAPALSLDNVGGNVLLYERSHIVSEDTPSSISSFYPMEFLDSEGHTESIAVSWSNAFKTGLLRELPSSPLNSCKILGSTTGSGGTPIEALLKGTNGYARFTKALTLGKMGADAEGKTITCPAMVFMQGESQHKDTTKEQYKTMALQLFSDMRNDAAAAYGQTHLPPIIVYQPKSGTNAVKMAYIELVEETDWIIGAGNVYMVPRRSIHLDPNGSRWFGEQCAKAMIKTIKENKKFTPLLIKDWTISGDTITVEFNKNIVLDTYSRETVGGIDIAGISFTQTVEGNKMIFKTSIPDLTKFGNIYLSYVEGSIRDASTYLATTDYADYRATSIQDPIAPNTNDIKDESGNIPFGEPYPMWNWLLEYIDFRIQ